MAKFRHKTTPHVVLMDGAPADRPWATFVNHEFETDDKKIIERLSKLDDVEQVEEPAEEPADAQAASK